MRLAIALLVGIALGVGGTLASQQLLDPGRSERARVERRVARVAAERDGASVSSVSCSQRAYPESTYDCEIQAPIDGSSLNFGPTTYVADVEGDRISVSRQQ